MVENCPDMVHLPLLESLSRILTHSPRTSTCALGSGIRHIVVNKNVNTCDTCRTAFCWRKEYCFCVCSSWKKKIHLKRRGIVLNVHVCQPDILGSGTLRVCCHKVAEEPSLVNTTFLNIPPCWPLRPAPG